MLKLLKNGFTLNRFKIDNFVTIRGLLPSDPRRGERDSLEVPGEFPFEIKILAKPLHALINNTLKYFYKVFLFQKLNLNLYFQ